MYSDALERKLQPIYDSIDSRSYKIALKHTDAALKKFPGNQLLSSLRAFALQRTGKSDEALALLQSIVDKGPESERVLHTMTFTYRAAGKPDAIVTAYAAAAEKHPQDLEILKGLFGAYAKELNFVKQQQIALKLAKAMPEEADTYSWWAIVSLALQARAAVLATPPGANAEQLMKLAETMIARQITKGNGSLPSFEALLLYTDILQGQGKAKEAAEIIKTATGTAAGGLKEDSRQLRAAALVRSGDLPAAAELFKEACLENTDDWWSWQLYLNCTLPSSVKHPSELNTPGIAFPVGIVGGLAEIWDSKHLEQVWQSAAAGKGEGDTEAVLDTAVRNAADALEALKTAVTNTGEGNRGQSRGAALAPLELACRMYRLGLHTGRQLSEAIAAVLPTICHSFSCAVDLRRYTSHLEAAEARAWLAEQVVKICEKAATSYEEGTGSDISNNNNNGNTSSNNKAAIKALWCRTNAHALEQELGVVAKTSSPPSSSSAGASAVEYAVQLVNLFSSNLDLSENLDPKDRGHGEDLVALAAASLVSASAKTRDSKTPSASFSEGESDSSSLLLLFTAILALEAAQVRRTVAAPLRLSACGVYDLLNAPKKATAQLTALDVKSILHESMTGHWALPALLASASPDTDFEPWLSGISNVHVDQVLEASESIFTAYEQGIYSKVPEFVDFWETLGQSYTRWSGTAENAVLKLRNSTGSTTGPGAAGLASVAQAVVKEGREKESRPQVDKIRFNEDLSTRPAWFPPAALDTRLAIAAWWEGEGEKSGHAMPAASEMWWGVTGAAERKIPQAEEWRQAQRNGLTRRQALPELLAGVLQSTTLAGEERETLLKLVNSAWAPETYPTNSTASKTLSSLLDISKALFSAGLAVHAAVRADTDAAATAAACDAACSLLEQLEQQFTSSLEIISALLVASTNSEDEKSNTSISLPLPGNAGPAVLAALLSEEALWSAACLPTWAKLIKARYPSTGDDVESSNILKTKLQDAVHAAGNGIYSALLAVKEQTSAGGTVKPAAVATEILSQIETTWPEASQLWSYETKFNPTKALEEVFAQQQAVVKSMHQLAAQATTSLKQFA